MKLQAARPGAPFEGIDALHQYRIILFLLWYVNKRRPRQSTFRPDENFDRSQGREFRATAQSGQLTYKNQAIDVSNSKSSIAPLIRRVAHIPFVHSLLVALQGVPVAIVNARLAPALAAFPKLRLTWRLRSRAGRLARRRSVIYGIHSRGTAY